MTNESDALDVAWIYQVGDGETRSKTRVPSRGLTIGRRPSSGFHIDGDRAAFVSGHHAEIITEQGQYLVRDLGSRNGTYVNGNPIKARGLKSGDIIQLGKSGPHLVFTMGSQKDELGEETLIAHTKNLRKIEAKALKQEQLVQAAVEKVRHERNQDSGNETHFLVADMVKKLISQHHRKYKIILAFGLCFTLFLAGGVSYYGLQLKKQKEDIDRKLEDLEYRLASIQDPQEMERLIKEINNYQDLAIKLQRNMLYELGERDAEADFIENEIRELMKEFGADSYSIPAEFLQKVREYILLYRSANRPHMENALYDSAPFMEQMRGIFAERNLPQDLAFVCLVESGLRNDARNPSGATGLWQFLPGTARAYGLQVNKQKDERTDPIKSTEAASAYFRDLILEFGSGSSVMLALAAYNYGPTRLKGKLRKVQNPIRQRNFWYLYRARKLPRETREYVPKVFAVMVIGRNPGQFGFQSAS